MLAFPINFPDFFSIPNICLFFPSVPCLSSVLSPSPPKSHSTLPGSDAGRLTQRASPSLIYDNRRLSLAVSPCTSEAEERKAALRRIPEQYLLSEVRRMVEEMQTLNKKLEETEAAIDEYFKPVEKEAKILMEMQLQGEERTMKEMVAAMQEQALLEKSEAEKLASMKCADPNKK